MKTALSRNARIYDNDIEQEITSESILNELSRYER